MIHETMRINGERVSSDRTIEVRNPYDSRIVGMVPMASADQVRTAIEKGRAFRADLSRHERAEILRTTARALDARRESLSELITSESGLARKDTRYEVGRAIDVFELAASLALEDDGEAYACDITPHGKRRRIFTVREPLLGVITAITPFNHPLNQVAHKVAPAIATNNRMVLKPSEKTPLTALALAEILHEAGLPPPMVSIVTGDPREIGDLLVTHPAVELVSFTGGIAVGKAIAAKAGYRRIVLELGGNDPLIVMEDADLDEAADLASAGSYRNSGQRCTAVKRILVHTSVAEAFVERLVERTRAVVYGDPMDPGVDMGTLIDEAAARYCEEAVDEAIALGAALRCGHVRRGALYAPTVLDHVPPGCRLVMRETFGPVSPVIRFSDVDEAIRISNSTPYGLSSGICTNRLDHVMRFVKELQVGTVNVREVPGFRTEMSPFGGIKDSGLGYKEGMREAMRGFTQVKTFSLPWA